MIVSAVLLLVILIPFVFISLPMFGKRPSGERLVRIKKSPNFRDGKFQNLSLTPDLTEGVSLFAVLKEFLFDKKERRKPVDVLPSKKTDLRALSPEKNVLVWFGHSSYFIQVDGKKMLVDPVLSGAASPIRATTRSFSGSDVYTVDDIPDIDFLFITHDHWDHLDYTTVKKLKPRIKKIICGLGTGQHFERWGFDSNRIIEQDWGDEITLADGFVADITPARHFSGRGLKRNSSLWMSIVLQTPTMKLFIGGDSGYDTHFAATGNKYGPFDLAMLECGQYNKNWKYIHMLPDETIRAAQDLKAKHLMPVHWSKFALAVHAWDDPARQVTVLGKINNQHLVMPMIGEEVDLKALHKFEHWWEKIN